jgi:predicted component of type VI protein secretion system
MSVVLKLKILSGKHAGREIVVPRSQFLIGRADECDLRPASPAVSRRHCALTIVGEGVTIEDFGGSNGTLVNDRRISGKRELLSGDRIRVGPLEFLALFAPATDGSSSAKPGAPAAAAQKAPSKEGAEDEILQWLTDVPGTKKKSIYLKIDDGPDASGNETGQISQDGTQPIPWPDSFSTTISGPTDKSAKPGKPADKPEPPTGDSRDAAAAAIDKFRNRNEK